MVQNTQRRALGRGLSALLDDIAPDFDEPGATPPAAQAGPDSGTVIKTDRAILPIESIEANAQQPRKYFDESELNELADSIREKGLLQPILVRPITARPGVYEIVAGERRWRAAQRAKLHDVPVVIRELEDTEALEIAIIENVQRSDLNAMEEAFGYRQLIERYSYTQDMLAKNVGKSRSHIANMMRLMNLPDGVQDMVRTGELTAGHARAILSANDPEAFARRVAKTGMSVREAEAAVKGGGDGGSTAPRASGSKPRDGLQDANTRLMEGELSAILRMPVSIKHRGDDGGEVRISYRTLDDLDDLCKALRGEEEEVFASS